MTDASAPAGRLPLIDALRGVAIVMMVVYHFCFDLSYLRLADFDFYNDPFWLTARTLILGTFLFLVGVSLVLATESGLDLRRYLRRLGYLIAAALLVSASSWWMFGERFVFFGVLHFIAVASVLGLLFVRAGWLNPVLAVAIVALTFVFRSAWFDQPGWRWIGLMTHKPPTEDYVPVLPWFGVVLLGIFAAPTIRNLARRAQLRQAGGSGWLALAGRHSLIVYLLHQPLLMGGLMLFAGSSPVSG